MNQSRLHSPLSLLFSPFSAAPLPPSPLFPSPHSISLSNTVKKVRDIWDTMIRSKAKPDTTLYTSILTACADWAKSSDMPDEANLNATPMLDLGKKVHKHIIHNNIRYFCIPLPSLHLQFIEKGWEEI
jgi:hypothetical protein